MAKTILDEQMRLTVVINGNEAQKELYDLEKRNRELNASTKALREEKSKLAAQGKKNTEEYKNITAEIKKNTTEVKANKARMGELQKQLGVTGLTMRQLKSRASELRLQLQNMVPGSAQYKKLEAELKQVNTQIQKVSLNSRAAESSLSKLAGGFNKFAALGASAIAVLTGFVLSAQKMIDYNGKLADAQSDVQKTTGLSAKAVDELSKSFGLMKTRTARIELLELAEEAGRLGKDSVKDVLSFVKVAEQLKIALGDDLGTEQIREVGKMVEIYKVGTREGLNFENSMLALGSSINEVAASGSNQAGYLVDFLKRTGGISDVANIAAQDMVGLAAAFDEAGVSQEISATAINKFFGAAAKDVSKFAKVAGVSVKEYSDMLNKDANQALIAFLKGMKKGDPEFLQLTERLKGIELGGTRGAEALKALASNIDKLEARQKIANNALKEGTSLSNEAALKNNNLAATIAKIQKSLYGLYSSATISEGLNDFMIWFGKFIGAVEDADGSVVAWKEKLISLMKIVILAVVAFTSYTTALKLVALWQNGLTSSTYLLNLAQKANALSGGTLRAVYLGLQYVYYSLTLQTQRATAAQNAFNLATKMNPVGLIVAALAAGVTAYYFYNKEIDKTTRLQRILNDMRSDAKAEIQNEVSALNNLLMIARDENQSKENRLNAIKQINKISPEYLGNITLEEINTLKAKQAVDEYIASIERLSMKKAFEARRSKAQEDLLAATSDKEKRQYGGFFQGPETDFKEFYKLEEENLEKFEQLTNGWNKYKFNAYRDYKKGIQEAKDELIFLQEEESKFIEDNADLYVNNTSPSFSDTEGFATTNESGTKDTSAADKRADQLKKEADELLKLQRENEDNRLAMIQDSFQREMRINDNNHLRKMEDLQRKIDENQKLADEALDPKVNDTNLASALIDQNIQLYEQMDLAEEQHQAKRNDILQKGIETHIKTIEEQYKREEQARQIAHNNELAALGNNEAAKEQLQKEFDQDRLNRQKENEQLLINEINKILDTSKFKDFSLEFLTAEQVQAIKSNLTELGLSISEINALLAVMQGKDPVDILGMTPGDIDVLGFSVDQWEMTFSNLDETKGRMEAVVMTATAMLNAYSMFSEFQSNSEKRRLQQLEKNTSLEKDKQARLLENKFISQKQHDDAVKNLDKELEKRKAEIAYNQAKRERNMAIANIAIQTGQAIMGIWAQVPKFDFGISAGLLTGIVSALGAAQIAMVATQPLPAKGFESGYYPVRREQDGKLFNASFGGESRSGVVDKPTVFLAGEGGKNFPEMIIDGRTLKQFDPELKNSLYRELGRIKGFEDGYYKNDSYQVPAETQDNGYASLAMALNRNSEILERLEENGIIAYMSKDLANIKKMRDELERLQKIENKAKINT